MSTHEARMRELEVLRRAKALLVNHNKGAAQGYDTPSKGYGICLSQALMQASQENAMSSQHFRYLDLIEQHNRDVIAKRLAEPHTGPDYWMDRANTSVKYNNHSRTTDADLQALLDNTIKALEVA